MLEKVDEKSIQSALRACEPEDLLQTGFADLDRELGGLRRGQTYLLGARPAMGKTTFTMNLALNMLMDGRTVYVFSYEQSSAQYIRRMVKLASDTYGEDLDAAQAIGRSNLYIDDATDSSIEDIMDACLEADQRPDVMIVDYVQLVPGVAFRPDATGKTMTELYEDFRRLAQDMNCPIILLSQVSRAIEQREDKRPVISDLSVRQITSVVDNVLFLYRDDYYDNESEDKGFAELHIAYSKNTQVSAVRLKFDPKNGGFS